MKLTKIIAEQIRYYFADKKGMAIDQDYSATHFLPNENHVLKPKNKYIPETMHRYDYREMGVLYNVYTKDSKTGYQKVTSIWDATHRKSLKRLEVLIK